MVRRPNPRPPSENQNRPASTGRKRGSLSGELGAPVSDPARSSYVFNQAGSETGAPKPPSLLFLRSEKTNPVVGGVGNEEFKNIPRIHRVRRHRLPVDEVGGQLNFMKLAIGAGIDVALNCVARWLDR